MANHSNPSGRYLDLMGQRNPAPSTPLPPAPAPTAPAPPPAPAAAVPVVPATPVWSRPDDATRQAALDAMKWRATGLLGFAGIVFILARAFEGQYPWLRDIPATAQASLLGRVADWFGVTALFRHHPRPGEALAPVPGRQSQGGRAQRDGAAGGRGRPEQSGAHAGRGAGGDAVVGPAGPGRQDLSEDHRRGRALAARYGQGPGAPAAGRVRRRDPGFYRAVAALARRHRARRGDERGMAPRFPRRPPFRP